MQQAVPGPHSADQPSPTRLSSAGALLAALLGLATSLQAAPGRWTSAGPFGGQVSSAAESAAQPGVILAATADAVFRSSNGGQNWNAASAGLFGLRAGELKLEAHPLTAGKFFLSGTRGVYFTLDQGRNWGRANSGLPVSNPAFLTVDIEIAPSEPERVYLLSEADGLYASLDGGGNWFQPGPGQLPGRLQALAVSPTDPDLLLVWSTDRDFVSFPQNLYRSSDGGQNFSPVSGPWEVPSPMRDRVSLLEFSPTSPGTVFLATDRGNFRSLDGGQSFSALPALPLNASQRLSALAGDPASPGRLLLGTDQGVLLTPDNGATLVPRNTGLNNGSGPASISAVLIRPDDGDRLLAFSASGDIYASANSGLVWLTSSSGLEGTPIGALRVHPQRPQRVFAGVRNERSSADSVGLYQSDDNAISWQRSNGSLLLDTVTDLRFDPATTAVPASSVLFATGEDRAPAGLPAASYRGGIFVSIDGGLNWSPADNLLPLPGGGARSLGLVRGLRLDASTVAGGRVQRLYFHAEGRVECGGSGAELVVARLWRSVNAATSWSPWDSLPTGDCSSGDPVYPEPAALLIDQQDPTALYLAAELQGWCGPCGDPLPASTGGVYRSNDGGQTWTPINNGLPQVATGVSFDAVALAQDPVSGRLYVALNPAGETPGRGRIFRSDDGGDNWSPADEGTTGGRINDLIIDSDGPGRVLATFAASGTSPGGVFASLDGGDLWISVSVTLPTEGALRLALAQPQGGPPTLHAGTGSGVYSLTRLPDGDRDGPDDATEDGAPNGGDGNNDNIPDRLQTQVASFDGLPGGTSSALEGGTATRKNTAANLGLLRPKGDGLDCEQLIDVHAPAVDSFPEDPGRALPKGLVRLTLQGCSSSTIRIIFHEEAFDDSFVFRRFGPTVPGDPLSFDWQPVPSAVRSGSSWTLTLTDNEPGDLRAETDEILFIGGPSAPDGLLTDGFEDP